MFAIAVNPLIHRLKQDTKRQMWFADDATAGGKLNNLREWWDCLTNILWLFPTCIENMRYCKGEIHV